jgi:hypothetical protein
MSTVQNHQEDKGHKDEPQHEHKTPHRSPLQRQLNATIQGVGSHQVECIIMQLSISNSVAVVRNAAIIALMAFGFGS